MDQPQSLTVEPVELREALPHFAALTREHIDTSGGLQAPADMVRGAECYRVTDPAGGLIGFYALRRDSWSFGRECVIVGAAGRAPVDLTATFIPFIEKQAAGCDALTVLTARKVLASKLLALGFGLDAFTLRKRLT